VNMEYALAGIPKRIILAGPSARYVNAGISMMRQMSHDRHHVMTSEWRKAHEI
jgi:hypothetical protein